MAYRVDLFASGIVIGMLFFEDDELTDAEVSAVEAVAITAADHAEVRNDAAALVFQYPPASCRPTVH
jgi:hypothetical protein